MNSITANDCVIHFNESSYQALNEHLKTSNYSKVFIIVDENTHKYCLPSFLENIEGLNDTEIIEIESGETNKTIETCVGIWNTLSDLEADRKSLIINLGGGVITDLGGFVASTFKRGIKFINVPTSLLSMVDASVGGKTGVDLGHLKNQIGVIINPEMVMINTEFLKTLPNIQLKSGMAEMLKHGLIKSKAYWEKFSDLSNLTYKDLDELIYESILIKKDIVDQDPYEKKLRKTLNFGHTLGHAIESYFLSNPSKKELLHGEAIAIGMILETHISTSLLGFSEDLCQSIKALMIKTYGKEQIDAKDFEPIVQLLKYDKKNEHGNINFVLLEKIGKPKIDCTVDEELIYNAFKFYNS
ncbi:3-dehydroquinate synthase [Yeosuana sp. MJ-SS3]|uniref:3-dehydroquinate synthase n=1 Tax=Gilvirhabdus luticola TaxID=3079858 RepID=A0ABU3U6Y3_9FLAO|nr:3-dehydroquinate synthase [Yeosuana sp. MJ-SS3]MDU8886157.1 3-dehydroquinate synthase [Yeosuana sp. MJ-SS3]